MPINSWTSVTESLEDVEADLLRAHTDDDIRAIGTKCRETVITLAQVVYSPERHLPSGATPPGPADSERMLALFMDASLDDSSATEARSFVRALLKLSHAVVHRRPASTRDAKLAVAGVRTLVGVAGILARQDVQSEPWLGVRVGPRFFAWDGPTLHALEDRQPIPAPEDAIKAMKEAGFEPSFGVRAKLRMHLAAGACQVYETDKRTWRKELLYSADGSQILLVKKGAA